MTGNTLFQSKVQCRGGGHGLGVLLILLSWIFLLEVEFFDTADRKKTTVYISYFWREIWKQQIVKSAISSAKFFSFSQFLILSFIFVN